MGLAAAPIKIKGAGSLEILPDVIIARGYTMKSQGLAYAAGILASIVASTAATVHFKLSQTASTSLTIGLCASLVAAMTAKNRSSGGTPVTLTFPRQKVKSARLLPDGCILVRVVDNKPSGELYFRPDSNPAELLSHITKL
ncbi:MAG: hypothetical protein U1F77_02310 [Kiritimatiellia bacterium]